MPMIDYMHALRGLVSMAVAVVAPEKTADASRSKKQEKAESALEVPAWTDDVAGYWPVRDRGGAMSEYVGRGDRGMIAVLAKIELGELDTNKSDT